MTQLELVSAQAEAVRATTNEAAPTEGKLSSRAMEFARRLSWLPGEVAARPLQNRCYELRQAFKPLLKALESRKAKEKGGSEDFRYLQENIFLVRSELDNTCANFDLPHKLPQVRSLNEPVVPRVAALT